MKKSQVKLFSKQEPGPGLFKPNDVVDIEVTQAFQNKTARLYSTDGPKDCLFIVIDGGKVA